MIIVYVDDDEDYLDLVKSAAMRIAALYHEKVELVFLPDANAQRPAYSEPLSSSVTFSIPGPDNDALLLAEGQAGNGPSKSRLSEYSTKPNVIFLLDQNWHGCQLFGTTLAGELSRDGVPHQQIAIFTQYPELVIERHPSPWYHTFNKMRFRPSDPERVEKFVELLFGMLKACLRERARNDLDQPGRNYDLIGQSPAFAAAWEALIDCVKVERVEPVFIWGEAGTFKQRYADALRGEDTFRHSRPGNIRCGALNENEMCERIIEAFSHPTPETVVLSEVESMPPRAQSVLLDILDTGFFRIGQDMMSVRARVVSLSELSPQALAEKPGFDRRLAIHLTEQSIHAPAIRERENDIELLGAHYAEKTNVAPHIQLKFGGSFLDFLYRYEWPGNERELEKAIKRAVKRAVSKDSAVLGIEHADAGLLERLPATAWYDRGENLVQNFCKLEGADAHETVRALFAALRKFGSSLNLTIQLRHAFQAWEKGDPEAGQFLGRLFAVLTPDVVHAATTSSEKRVLGLLIALMDWLGESGLRFLIHRRFSPQMIAAEVKTATSRDDRNLHTFIGKAYSTSDSLKSALRRLVEES